MQSNPTSWLRQVEDLVGMALVVGAFVWLLWRSLRRNPEPLRLLSKWVITGVVLLGLLPVIKDSFRNPHPLLQWFGIATGLIGGLILAVIWTTTLTGMVADWFGILYTGGRAEPDPEPVYSPARARRINGQPEEALQLIRAELEKFPEDYTGQMLMAEIYAQDMADLQAAEACVMRVARQLQHPPAARAFALFSLADWYLSVHKSPADAQRILAMVQEIFPDSEYSLQAAQRLAHLQPEAMMAEREEPRSIKVPEGRRDLGLRPLRPEEIIKSKSPEEEVEELVLQLEKHPLDLTARERLAQVYAMELGRLDLAVEQLEQLVNCPHVAPKQVAHWLQMMADFYLQVGHDPGGAKLALQRIVDSYPNTALAAQAQEAILRLPSHPHVNRPAQVRLGQYEPYIGLKKARSPTARL